jgi:hypothetical protein
MGDGQSTLRSTNRKIEDINENEVEIKNDY